MNTLRSMYGLRRVCLPVTSILLSAITIHLLELPSETSATNLIRGLRDLETISLNHPFAVRCIGVIGALATKWNITLPEGAAATIAAASDSAGRNQWHSPASSSFQAPSIPPKGSSEGGRSSASIPSHPESSFRPHSLPQRQQQSFQAAFGDTRAQLDPSETHSTFWTQYPAHTMPLPPQNIVPSMPASYSPMDSSGAQWSVVDRSATGTSSIPYGDPSQHLDEQRMDDTMDYTNWGWQ